MAGREVVGQLLARPGPHPTAIFANSDEMAIGAILAAEDHGLRDPQDLSVIGIDNHELSESFGLTTMAQDPYEQGRLGARILLNELNGGPLTHETSTRAPAHLIERTSTAPPRTRNA